MNIKKSGTNILLPLFCFLIVAWLLPNPARSGPGDGAGGGPSSAAIQVKVRAAPAPYPGRSSYYTLTTSNGLSAATYTLLDQENPGHNNKLFCFKNHIYSFVDESMPSIDYLYDAYFGYRKNGHSDESSWLYNTSPSAAEYLPGTGIIRTTQEAGGFIFDSYYFIPFHDPAGDGRGENRGRFILLLVEVTNEGGPVSDNSLFALFNFHAGGEGDPLGETIRYDGEHRYLAESKGATRFIYKSLVENGCSYTADGPSGANNPWVRVNDGLHYENYPPGSLSTDDIAAGLEWRIAEGDIFPGGASFWFGAIVGFTETLPEGVLVQEMESFTAGRTPDEILNDEIAWWDAWHLPESPPSLLGVDEAALYRQSTAVLKMGQVREEGRGYGQVLASLIPGIWNICWVRDASYAVLGFVAAGHVDEAKAGLEFMLNAEMKAGGGGNFYQEYYIEPDLGVTLSADYAVSVCRHYGNGREESDHNSAGPNIEFDNWGLLLWACGDYAGAAGDTAFVAANWPVLSSRVADLLIDLIEPEKGILLQDSSIWERHWGIYGSDPEPETRKQFAYSSICAYRGLIAAAEMARSIGEASDAARYDNAADHLRQGVLTHFVTIHPETGLPVLAGNMEELLAGKPYMDLAVVEAINTGLAPPGSDLARGTIAAFDNALSMEGEFSPGYFRNDDGAHYDRQEWVVIDLRLASALAKMGEYKDAKTLLRWVTNQAEHNFNLVSELYSEEDGGYAGAIPMCGFGPGAYILALHDFYGQ